MKTKLYLFLAAVMCFVSLHAEEFTVKGIKYNGDEATMTATVVGTEDNFNEANVVIPEIVNGYTVTSIGDRAFRGTSLKSFIMPNTVICIGYRSFFRCTDLESITVSNTLMTIGDQAFRECTNLKAIVLPETIEEIGALAFEECSNIESIEIPVTAPLEIIQQGCFTVCSKLASFTMPSSVKTIKDNAFQGCSSLSSLYLPSSVTKIEYDEDKHGHHPFIYCSNLKSIIVDKNNPVYDSRDNCNSIIETATNKLMVGCMNSTIPTGVIEIGPSAFCEQYGLSSIEIPSTVTTIDDMAFMESGLNSINIPSSITNLGLDIFNRCNSLISATLPDSWESIPCALFIFCTKLENVNIPNSVKSIEEMAFRRCESLKTIDIPQSVETIGRQAFQGCVSMECVTIPESVKTIEGKAFGNCNSLKSVTSLFSTPFELNEDVFQNVNVNEEQNTTTSFTSATLYVPKGCKEKYKATAGWNQFKIILEEGELLGDANGNGMVEADDVLCVTNYILGKNPSPFNESAADLTGNGKVDVEDVTSLVDIILGGKTYGYFYFGTTQPTEDNYQTLSGTVASYTSIGDAIGATASIDAGQTVYMLCPAAWMKSKKVILEDGAGSTYNFIEDIDAKTVPGYVIYRTHTWEEATDLTLNFEITGGDEYYWYAGQTDPSSMSLIVTDTSLPGWRYTGDSLDAQYSYDTSANSIVGTSKAGWYFALPQNSDLGVFDAIGTNYAVGTPVSTVEFENVIYNVWMTGATRNFNAYYIRNK